MNPGPADYESDALTAELSPFKKKQKQKNSIKLTVPELKDLNHSFALAQGGMLNDSVKTFFASVKNRIVLGIF